jgi:glycosyltransferase involved in cell wall biosynthesis
MKKSVITLADIVVFVMAVFMVAAFAIALSPYLFRRKRAGASGHKDNELLFLAESASYETLKSKGVLYLLDTHLCGGYFQKISFVHFPAAESRTIRLNDSIDIIEIRAVAEILKLHRLIFSYTLINAAWYFLNIFYLRAFTMRNISIIRGAGAHHTALAALFLYRLTGVPTCISIHSDDQGRYEKMKKYGSFWAVFNMRSFTVLVHRFVFTHAPIIFIVRESLGGWARRMGALLEQIRLFPHGIDIENFLKPYDGNIRREFGLTPAGRLVVFAGRLSQENYVYDMVKIAKRVAKGMEDAVFVVIGDGPERKALEHCVKEKGLDKHFRFLGFLPQNKVYEFRKIACANLCLMAGYSLIEAALSKRPVISYDVEWHYELIKNNETGFLVREHDIETAADATIALLSDSSLAARLGENAFRLALERHDARKNDKEKIRLYEELKKLSN